jgi:hypothetical protein
VWLAADGTAQAELRAPGTLAGNETENHPKDGELLVFRPGARMVCTPVRVLERLRSLGEISFPVQRPLEIGICVWRCGRLSGSLHAAREAEEQVAALNRCLAEGAAPADSGIRAKLAAVRDAPALPLDRPTDLDCFSPLEPASLELRTVDVYLHAHPFPARACPMRNRIFLGTGLDRFTLAHEFAHLLGMPQRAHVDENPYLRRGNVMDTTPAGGKGELTLGQICIFNLHLHSLAARMRANLEPRFPLRRCLDEGAEPVRGPSLSLALPRP